MLIEIEYIINYDVSIFNISIQHSFHMVLHYYVYCIIYRIITKAEEAIYINNIYLYIIMYIARADYISQTNK